MGSDRKKVTESTRRKRRTRRRQEWASLPTTRIVPLVTPGCGLDLICNRIRRLMQGLDRQMRIPLRDPTVGMPEQLLNFIQRPTRVGHETGV